MVPPAAALKSGAPVPPNAWLFPRTVNCAKTPLGALYAGTVAELGDETLAVLSTSTTGSILAAGKTHTPVVVQARDTCRPTT